MHKHSRLSRLLHRRHKKMKKPDEYSGAAALELLGSDAMVRL